MRACFAGVALAGAGREGAQGGVTLEGLAELLKIFDSRGMLCYCGHGSFPFAGSRVDGARRNLSRVATRLCHIYIITKFCETRKGK